jgi:hypothetical protein
LRQLSRLLRERLYRAGVGGNGMSNKQGKRFGRVNPGRLADEANFKFVGFAAHLMDVVDWNRPIRHLKKGKVNDSKQRPQDEKSNTKAKSRPYWSGFAFDPKVLAALSKKMERILKRHEKAGVPNPRAASNREEISFSEEELESKLKELFHQDAWHRLAAIRWLRQHGCSEAISALEGVLSIEESDEVRGEIERALHVLRIRRISNKGELKCSKSSEVSL